ncbi:MAG TPA: hypothetical protein VJS37_01580 [Terriglobales bacterium]|nr:hypothetical protein [Terriglobales bacterium]
MQPLAVSFNAFLGHYRMIGIWLPHGFGEYHFKSVIPDAKLKLAPNQIATLVIGFDTPHDFEARIEAKAAS